MNNKTIDHMRLLAAALSLTCAATGCGTEGASISVAESAVGSIGFNLELPIGLVVDTLDYAITNPDLSLTQKKGTLSVANNKTTFLARIDGIRAGSGYQIELTSGQQSSGAAVCRGTAVFTANVGVTTTVKVRLSCPGPRKLGTVVVDGEVNVCAVVESAVAMRNPEGNSFALTSEAVDDDAKPVPLIYHWTATPASAGRFGAATAPATTFTCLTSGVVTLAFEALDGDCGDKMVFEVLCEAPGGGVSGGGGVAGMPAGGSADGGLGGHGGGIAVDGPGFGYGGSGGAGGEPDFPRTCRDCVLTEQDGVCAEGLMAYESSPKYVLARPLEQCVRQNRCASASGGYALIDCYCGTTAFEDCYDGTIPGNGVCKAELEAAVETTVVSEVIARVTDPRYAAGLLDQELGCENAICNTLSTICEL
jgi:hypothetical protein